MARIVVLALGALALLVDGLVFIYRDARTIEAELTQATNAALARAGGDGMRVVVRGQHAYIEGAALSEAARVKASEALWRVLGRDGGFRTGAVTRVVVTAGLLPESKPFGWRAQWGADGRLVLSGSVPDEATRATLLAHARLMFPTAIVDDRMVLARGVPAGDWLAAANAALDRLAKLVVGVATMTDTKYVVTGEARDDEAAEAVTAAMARTIAGYEGSAEVLARLAEIGTVGDCQILFDRRLAGGKIEFETGSAAISPASSKILDQLLRACLRCKAFKVSIAGHTDNVGEPDLNQRLSEERAAAVVAYLTARGIEAARLSSAGFGETRPVADNAGDEGRARNRRIEFTVSQ